MEDFTMRKIQLLSAIWEYATKKEALIEGI